MSAPSQAEHPVTAARSSAAVTLYVIVVAIAALAAAAIAFADREAPLEMGLFAFIALAAVTDLREVRLPAIGHVTLSFVPVLAALIVFGLWPALIVAAVSGLATVTVTNDAEKIAFNVADYVLSTYLAGLVYLALAETAAGGLGERVLPAFTATAVDFVVNTVLLAGVIALATGDRPLRIWQRNYQWGLPSYLAGASLALLVAWLYLRLGVAGLVVGLPPLYLIYYSYDVYVGRVRDRAGYDRDMASFREQLSSTLRLQDELREAQLKVAAEIERARVIQRDLLPREAPVVPGLELAHRIEFMSEMGGDYFDFLPLDGGRLGVVCGDVMGKGLAAALIMAMTRTLLHQAVEKGEPPGAVLAEVNDALTRDLEGQTAPCFVTLAYAEYDPARRALTVASGGHNPLLVLTAGGTRECPSRGSLLGMREGLAFPEDTIELSPGDAFVLYTDGVTESRAADRELFGAARLRALLEAHAGAPPAELLDAVWDAAVDFRRGAPAGDDATLLVGRVSAAPGPRALK